MSYIIHKQLIPKNNLIWVTKLNGDDTILSYETLEEAESKKDELISSDPTGRIYKVSFKNEDGSFSDI